MLHFAWNTSLAFTLGTTLSSLLLPMVALALVAMALTGNEPSPSDPNSDLEQLRSENLELKQAIENLRVGLTRFQSLIAKMPIPCIGCDTEGLIYEWNEAAEQTFGHHHYDVFEHLITREILPGDKWAEFKQKIDEAVSSDDITTFEMEACTADERTLIGEWRLMPIHGQNGKIASLLITCADITEREAERQRLSELAHKDALTSLLNRRAILNQLDRSISEIVSGKPVSIILFDIDKFKTFNDTFGHPAGDALLRRSGEILRDLCGDTYFAGRYGGEEFIIVLPNANIETALGFAESIRAAFPVRTEELNGGATASFGVATLDDPTFLTAGELIQSADKALYAAKHRGRNQVIAAPIDDETANAA